MVNRNAFEDLNQLKALNLSRNEISAIENETFVELTGLIRLDLSFNLIGSIDLLAFAGLNDLGELNLSNNRITELAYGAFDFLLNLRILNLSFNLIQEMREEIFTSINVIEEFYIQNNRLSFINPTIVSDFERAKVIDFRQNTCIDSRFPENVTMVQLALEVASRCTSF